MSEIKEMAGLSLEELWVLLKTEQDGEHLSIQSLGFKHNSADIHIYMCMKVVCNKTSKPGSLIQCMDSISWIGNRKEMKVVSACLLRFLKH